VIVMVEDSDSDHDSGDSRRSYNDGGLINWDDDDGGCGYGLTNDSSSDHNMTAPITDDSISPQYQSYPPPPRKNDWACVA
jgi:hypothetical protein